MFFQILYCYKLVVAFQVGSSFGGQRHFGDGRCDRGKGVSVVLEVKLVDFERKRSEKQSECSKFNICWSSRFFDIRFEQKNETPHLLLSIPIARNQDPIHSAGLERLEKGSCQVETIL